MLTVFNGVRKVIIYAIFMGCATLLTLKGMVIPQEMVWVTGIVIGAKMYSEYNETQKSKNGNGNSNGSAVK